MKYYCLVILLFLSMQIFSLTIVKSDYGWAAGKVRNFKEGSWTQSSTDLTEGTGKVWNFNTPNVGYQNTFFQSCSNVSGFPNANLVQQYTQFLIGTTSSGNTYFQETSDDFLQIGYTGSPNLVWSPAMPTGLPHYLNKTWQGSYSYGYGSYNITGKVIAEGTLTTHWGTHQASLVRYYYVSQYLSYYCYQWETKEYGIEAFTNTLNGGMLYVLDVAEPNIVANEDEISSPSLLQVQIFPNPAKETVNLKVSSNQQAVVNTKIYNIKGELVYHSNQNILRSENTVVQWDEKNLNGQKVKPGIYLYQIESGSQKARGTFVIVE